MKRMKRMKYETKKYSTSFILIFDQNIFILIDTV